MSVFARYVRQHGIEALFQRVTKRILQAQPDNPVAFAMQCLEEERPDQASEFTGKKKNTGTQPW